MVDVLQSPLLRGAGFAHGFTLRTGGVSQGPFATANFGRDVGDDPAAVEENHRRLASNLGFERLFEVRQVHGRSIRSVEPDEDPAQVRRDEADGLIATRSGLALGVRVADCVPVLLANPVNGAVAAVHAGWRGIEARIVPAAVEGLGGGDRLLVALGPHIRQANFEVGPEVAERLASVAHGQDVVAAGGARPHVDLARILRAQLAAAGIDADRIDDVGGGTFAEPARFFSYRRDGGRTGRHIAAIVAR